MSTHHFQALPVSSRADWFRIHLLYQSAFPRSEQKPFAIIRAMWKKGKTDVWVFFHQGKFVGFAATINSDTLILLDYLAISPPRRGQGLGSMALQALRKAYPELGLFVEIESVYQEGDDQEERMRRRQFYLSNGMEPLHVLASVFGVPMELLGWDCEMTFSQYHAFYRDQYSPHAAAHILPLEFPR